MIWYPIMFVTKYEEKQKVIMAEVYSVPFGSICQQTCRVIWAACNRRVEDLCSTVFYNGGSFVIVGTVVLGSIL